MTLRLIDRTAETVRATADAKGIDAVTIAQATGLNQHEINDRLSGVTSFTVSELVQAGGLFRVPAAELLKGTPA